MVAELPGTGSSGPDKKKGVITLSPLPSRLVISSPDPEDLDSLADELKLTSPSKYHRLPPLTFLRFEFENASSAPWKLHLLKSGFTDSAGNTYLPLTAKDYTEQFTSVAYEHFRYDSMYASYITHRDGVASKGTSWYTKSAPEQTTLIRPKEAGYQIVPFRYIPAGVRSLVFKYPVDETHFRELNIRLTTERGS
jgi:hypothetical protein